MQSLSHLLAFQLQVRMAIVIYLKLLGVIGCYAEGDLAIRSSWELLAACARAMLLRRIARTQLCSINKKDKKCLVERGKNVILQKVIDPLGAIGSYWELV